MNRIAQWLPARGMWHAVVLPLLLFAPVTSPVRAALRLEILRGEGSNNNAVQGTAISPAVRVLDEGGQPLAGVLVVFSPPAKGASLVFAGFDSDADALTDESGVAVAPHVRPTGGNGPVEIRVMASHAGEFANCVINQINLGVEGEAEREKELDIVRLPGVMPPGSKPATSGLLIRVEDAKGSPVPLATVLFVLRRVGNDGKAEELSRMTITAGQDGEAFGTIPKRSGNGRLEFMVQAAEGGRRATRYFSIE